VLGELYEIMADVHDPLHRKLTGKLDRVEHVTSIKNTILKKFDDGARMVNITVKLLPANAVRDYSK
jgi:hypothetical protein